MIIGICGLIGSGKGTVADHLIDQHNFKKISFADKLKDAVAEMFDWPRHMLEGVTPQSRDWRERPDAFWSNELDSLITPRYVLQVFGTECMRQGFYDGIWVSLVKKKIQDNPTTNWVIPDTRFPNEVDMIKSVGGQVWCIKRGENPQWFDDYKINGIPPKEIHASEWAWANSAFDLVIENNASMSELYQKIVDCITDQQ
jgi:hypothetical protein